MSAIGAVWIAVALHSTSAILVACALLPSLFLITRSLTVSRAAKHIRLTEAPLHDAELAAERALGKRFAWIFGAEGIAIFVAVNVLANIGQSAFLLPTVGVIVGLHFLPLAQVFGYPLYYCTGVIQIALCVGTAFALRSKVHELNIAVGLEMGLTVWITVPAVLLNARQLQARLAAKSPG